MVRHLKVFDCIYYAHVPSEKRIKLDEKNKKCIFVTYNSNAKKYQLYDVEVEKLIISRDVIFDEIATWNWKEKQELKQPHVLYVIFLSFVFINLRVQTKVLIFLL